MNERHWKEQKIKQDRQQLLLQQEQQRWQRVALLVEWHEEQYKIEQQLKQGESLC